MATAAATVRKPRLFPSGGPLKRHVQARPGKGRHLAADHPAFVESRTLFPSTVVDAADSPRLLTSGEHQRKIGKRVVKGRWSGMPIYCLTLEERATCPPTCQLLSECYGNNMHLARRHRDDGELMPLLWCELEDLAAKHPQGFVVRLHILGDFYSVEYARFWDLMLRTFPALRIFGFTAHAPGSEIGRRLVRMNAAGDRCWIRFSGDLGAMGSLVVATAEAATGVVCPAQTDPDGLKCCSDCGLCWTMQKPIYFARH